MDAKFNEVWAFYKHPRSRRGGEIGWEEQITSDTASKLKILRTLLSPSCARYFYVEVLPEFADSTSTMHPQFDDSHLGANPGELQRVPWEDNSVAMRLHVYRLSGERVTTIDLPRSYCGDYAIGRWLDERWIWLRHRRGHASGNWYSLFVNSETGEKRLVGFGVKDPAATVDGKFVAFRHRGVLYLNFRPVYPMYGEQLPDFGQMQGWESYRDKYLLRNEKLPFLRIDKYPHHYVLQYDFTPDGNKVVLLDQRAYSPRRALSRATALYYEPPPDALAPQLVFVDLEKVETTKDPNEYGTAVLLPRDHRTCLERDDKKGEFRVWAADGRTVLWRRSFAELEALSP